MEYIGTNMKTFPGKTLELKISIVYLVILFILPSIGFAEPKHILFASSISNSSEINSSSLSVDNPISQMAVKASVSESLQEHDFYHRYVNDDTPFTGELIPSEQFAEQMMEQALMLCQKSQEHRQRG